MSQADIQRFVSDLKDNQVLLDEVKSGAVGLASLVELAQARGYDISVDEAKAYIRGQASQELSDEQLDAVAGGKGHHRDPHKTQVATSVSAHAIQTVTQVSTEAVNSQTSAFVVAEAVAVVVLT